MMQDLEPFYSQDDEMPVEKAEEDGTEVLRGRLRRSNGRLRLASWTASI